MRGAIRAEPRWGREDDPGQAVERLLDAAGMVFARHGVFTAKVNDVAVEAGCSRGTLYRYFPDGDALRFAFVEREARRIGAEVAGQVRSIVDPGRRLVAAILVSLDAVRGNEVLQAWFDPTAAGRTNRLAMQVEVVSSMLEPLVRDVHGRAGSALATEWVVRVILSLLAHPADPADERRMLERYLLRSLS